MCPRMGEAEERVGLKKGYRPSRGEAQSRRELGEGMGCFPRVGPVYPVVLSLTPPSLVSPQQP